MNSDLENMRSLILELEVEKLELLEENRRLRKANLSFAPNQIKLKAENKKLKEQIIELEKDSKILRALEAGGVDNWEWYGESLKEIWEEDE